LLVVDLDVPPPRSVLLDGDEPHIGQLGTAAEDDAIIADRIATLRARRPDGNVGIIGASEMLDRLRIDLAVRGFRVAHAAEDLRAPVVLLHADQMKGLEFDDVIIVEPEVLYRSDAIAGPRRLYVAMTRARSTLTLLSRGRLPAALTGVGLTSPIELPAIVGLSAEAPSGFPATDTAGSPAPDSPAPRRRTRRPGGPNVPMDDAGLDAPAERTSSTLPVEERSVLFTDHEGIERRRLVEHAQALGMRVEPTVSARTDVIVVGEITVQSRRARKARELSIPFASAAAFLATTRGGTLEVTRFESTSLPDA
jgi:hypothetical protein